MSAVSRESQESIRVHSKSFSLASRVLPEPARTHAVSLYAWCRRADDAVDLVEGPEQSTALSALSGELDGVYDGASLTDPILIDFQ